MVSYVTFLARHRFARSLLSAGQVCFQRTKNAVHAIAMAQPYLYLLRHLQRHTLWRQLLLLLPPNPLWCACRSTCSTLPPPSPGLCCAHHRRSSCVANQLSELMLLAVVFMGSPSYLRSPHLRGKLCELVYSLLPQQDDGQAGSFGHQRWAVLCVAWALPHLAEYSRAHTHTPPPLPDCSTSRPPHLPTTAPLFPPFPSQPAPTAVLCGCLSSGAWPALTLG